jgi:uncharacterized protein YajQ (UPF0234 family)
MLEWGRGDSVAKDNSFDIVSEPDWGELGNAVDQTRREADQRYDFRGHDVHIDWSRKEGTVTLEGPAGMVLDALVTAFEQKCARRNVSLRFLDAAPMEPLSGDRGRVVYKIRAGLTTETAKRIQQAIRATKIKVDAQIQEDIIRVSGKSRDDLQAVIAAIKTEDFGVELQFTNYR